MFKHYLTYQFALSFERACGLLELPPPARQELQRCTKNAVQFFTEAIHAKKPKEEARHLFVTITYLRDAKELVDRAEGTEENLRDARARYDVLHARLEQIFLKLAECENGQMRMLG